MVEIVPGDYRLLDIHQLLVAQTKVHELISKLLIKMYKKMEKRSQVDGLTNLSRAKSFFPRKGDRQPTKNFQKLFV